MCEGGGGGGILGDDCPPEGAIVAAGAAGSNSTNTPKPQGTPQVTPTPGHDLASVNMANDSIKDAEADGRTIDGVHYNQSVEKATEGDLQGAKRPDAIVRSTAPDGTKHIALNEATAGKSGQTVANQEAKLKGIAATAAPGVKVTTRASGFNAVGKLLSVFGIAVVGYELATNPDYHAADALQDVSPIPIQGAY